MPTLIGKYKNYIVLVFIDNYKASATNFDTLFYFLYTSYFPRYIFSLVYLSRLKTHLFINSIEVLGF